MMPIALVMGLPTEINSRIVRLTLLRALAAIGYTFCFVAAVRLMPIADALAIAFVSPFILFLMGGLILTDEVGSRRIAAAVVAFLGTVLVIQPSFARFGTTAFLPIGSAFCFAPYMLVTASQLRSASGDGADPHSYAYHSWPSVALRTSSPSASFFRTGWFGCHACPSVSPRPCATLP